MNTTLLLDEPCIVLQPSLVRKLGNIHDAAILQQLHYWTPRATAQHAGRTWVYKTYPEWATEIGISTKQVRAAMGRLETSGVVESCQPEVGQWQRRKWYRINYEHPLIASDALPAAPALQGTSNGPTGRNEQPDGTIRTAPEGPSKAETTTEITTEITTEEPPASLMPVCDGSDASRLAVLLADLIEGNGCKRPTVTARWVQTIERMIRIDGRSPEQVENAMRWCQQHEFWKSNVMSPDKLRQQYDRLRLQAQREMTSGQPKGMAGVRQFLEGLEA